MASGLFISHAQANAEAAALNVNPTGFGAAHLRIYSDDYAKPVDANAALGTQKLLADFTLPAAGNNTINNGVITFGTIDDVTATETGTASWFRITAADGTTVVCDGTVGVAGDTPDLVLNSVAITIGATVSITSFTYTITE
jgi:hypothetical protein